MKDQTTTRGLRCAIYTRVSTDQGLEQDFNSLDPSEGLNSTLSCPSWSVWVRGFRTLAEVDPGKW